MQSAKGKALMRTGSKSIIDGMKPNDKILYNYSHMLNPAPSNFTGPS